MKQLRLPINYTKGYWICQSFEIVEGDLPNRAHTMVQEWAGVYRDDLLNMWETQSFKKLPELE